MLSNKSRMPRSRWKEGFVVVRGLFQSLNDSPSVGCAFTKLGATGLLLLFVATCGVSHAAQKEGGGAGKVLAVVTQNEASAKPDQNENGAMLFAAKIMPLFKAKCLACHGEDPKGKIKGGFDMRSRQDMLKGGESETPGFVPNQPAKSFLVQAIKWTDPELQMPPKKNDRLSAQQVKDVERWIRLGAPWPSGAKRVELLKQAASNKKGDGVVIKTLGGLSDEWTYRRYKQAEVWSFLPMKKVTPPKVDGVEHAIDSFVVSKLRAAQLIAAPKANKRTLIRRATFDLTGLPPTPQEINAFVKDGRPDAWEKLIDRLLASKRYGERWAQHWLDVVRYGDTSGYSNDYERPNAWRYRDYVIRSFNSDKPYRRFVLEQIAGEELDLKRPINPELLIAQGYLRMGPWEHTAMSPKAVSRQGFLDDVVNHVGQTFLATPLRCAKCHDHKFDPIPTSDYYRIYAAFSTTQPAERHAAFLDVEDRSEFESNRKHVEELLAYAKEKVNLLYAKREDAAKKWYADRGRSKEYQPFEKRRQTKSDDKPRRFVGLTTQEEGRVKVREQDVRIWSRRLQRYQPKVQSVYSGGDLHQNSAYLHMPNPKNKAEMAKSRMFPENYIYSGGSVYSKLRAVTPGVLSGAGVPSGSTSTGEKSQGVKTDVYALPTSMAGRRLALAKWIVDRRNPLTWRAVVNRIWQSHFGKGIAGNPNNFGASGKQPTHPLLLDWLATEFRDQGGSFKAMHRLIMTSAVYQQSSQHPNRSQILSRDPNNELLAVFQPRRMDAEELRDSVLSITGEINLKSGGLPVFPEINMEVALSPRMIQFSIAPAYQPSRTPDVRNRRSIYAYRTRGLRDPMMVVFNKPISDESCERRDAATVTPQVFTLFNGDTMTKRSIAFALRLQSQSEKPADQIALGFKLAFGRDPAPKESARLLSHYAAMVKYHQSHKPEPKQYPKTIVRSLVEEFTGEPFTYVELLNAYHDYTPDKHAWDVTAKTRAIADVCLLIVNSNEFIYVY